MRLAARAALTLAITLCGAAIAAPGASACDLDRDEAARHEGLLEAAAAADATAVEPLRQAWAICPDGPTELLLAQAYDAADDCQMSRFWYEQVLARVDGGDAEGVSTSKGPLVERLTGLERACPDSARVVVTSAEAGTRVTMQKGDRTIALAPLPFPGRVSPGEWTLTAERDGYATWRSSIAINPDEQVDVQVPALLAPDGPGQISIDCQNDGDNGTVDGRELPCTESVTGDGSMAVSVTVDGDARPLTVELAENRDTLVRVIEPEGADSGLTYADWGWVALTSGVVLGGVSAGLFVAALSLQDTVDNPARIDENGTVISITQKQAQAIEDRRANLEIAAFTTAGIGGALLITGIVLFALPTDPYPSTRIAIVPGPDGSASIQVGTRF